MESLPMYDLVDRPAAMLGRSGRLLLWAMRGWHRAQDSGTAPPVALNRAFASLGIAPILSDFHVAMSLLTTMGPDRISRSPLDSPRIGEGEAVLLTLWADTASKREDQAERTLTLLTGQNLAGPLSSAMAATLDGLEACGFGTADMLGLARPGQAGKRTALPADVLSVPDRP
ncbi:MAG: hypothetical protein QM690_18685 [Sphingobium sp.]